MSLILQFHNISKRFPGVQALQEVSLDVYKGEILGIMGENGAGKSTLMKIAAGLYHPDQGSILLNGNPVTLTDPQKALSLGIGMIPQELNLVPEMNVGENIMLGLEPRGALGTLNRATLYRQAREILASLGLEADTTEKVKNLSVAQQQMIQIARALANRCYILIMDEPTAALSQREIDNLMVNIRRLKDNGVTILYISHHIREVRGIADRIAVLRDGQLVTVRPGAEMTEADITQAMIGRPLKEFLTKRNSDGVAGDVLLEAVGLTDADGRFTSVSFVLREGEILGIAGLVGAGRSEVFASIFGFRKLRSGEIRIRGARATIKTPFDAVRYGLGFVPEERKRQGLFTLLSVLENVSIPFVRRFQTRLSMNSRREREEVAGLSHQLHVRTPSLQQSVRYLSGGNQQKVILARWLGSGATVLILDEPTRGIDVNAKVEIHSLIQEVAAQGKGVVIISSEAQELMAIADRIIIMREGRVVGEVDQRTATEEEILRIAMFGSGQGKNHDLAS